MIVQLTNLYFRSPKEASLLRDRASSFCAIPPVGLPSRSEVLRVLFHERAHERIVQNAEEICQQITTRGWHSKIADYGLPMCDRIALLRWADIIVVLMGGHVEMVYQACPGTVVIIAHPYLSLNPYSKELLIPAGMLVLDLPAPSHRLPPTCHLLIHDATAYSGTHPEAVQALRHHFQVLSQTAPVVLFACLLIDHSRMMQIALAQRWNRLIRYGRGFDDNASHAGFELKGSEHYTCCRYLF